MHAQKSIVLFSYLTSDLRPIGSPLRLSLAVEWIGDQYGIDFLATPFSTAMAGDYLEEPLANSSFQYRQEGDLTVDEVKPSKRHCKQGIPPTVLALEVYNSKI